MEIDVVYLKALIQDCHDPMMVMTHSNLSGEAHSEQHARESLLSHFSQPGRFTHDHHAAQIEALRYLGVDIPQGESISVFERKESNTP